MSRSPEAKERDRLAAIARRAARKAGTTPAIAAAPVATLGEPIPQALRAAVEAVKPVRRTAGGIPRFKPAKAPSASAKPRGGARQGAGAPTAAEPRMRVITWKGTEAHHKAFNAAGGGAWLRGVLDAGVANGAIKVPK